VTRVCQRCGSEFQDWVQVCPDCRTQLVDSKATDTEDDLDAGLSIEFTLLSGETISVRDELPAAATEDSVQAYATKLIDEIGHDTIRTFSYWWQGEYYVDAIRMREVAAISVSTVSEDDDSEEWEE
jgi:hypothetical protein